MFVNIAGDGLNLIHAKKVDLLLHYHLNLEKAPSLKWMFKHSRI
jgi:hypothetical protein